VSIPGCDGNLVDGVIQVSQALHSVSIPGGDGNLIDGVIQVS